MLLSDDPIGSRSGRRGLWSHDGDPIRITDDPIRDPGRVRVITAIRR